MFKSEPMTSTFTINLRHSHNGKQQARSLAVSERITAGFYSSISGRFYNKEETEGVTAFFFSSHDKSSFTMCIM